MKTLLSTTRFAARVLRKSPGLVSVVVLSLVLGIGANTTLFSLFSAAILQEPTAFEPERLVNIEPGNGNQISYPNYRDLLESRTLPALAAYRMSRVALRVGTEPQNATAMVVTANFFDVLGARAARGRVFSAGEADPAREPRLAVISHGFWVRRLNGDPRVLGRDVELNGAAFTVVGVLPEDHRAV